MSAPDRNLPPAVALHRLDSCLPRRSSNQRATSRDIDAIR
jgi:hypothetical protein